VLDREGRAYEHTPGDAGGETKYGICKRDHPNLDIKNLTEQQATDIYFRDYWAPLNCDSYDDKLALAVFDTSVNNGKETAALLIAKFNGKPFTMQDFLFKRLRVYMNIVQAKPKNMKFLMDWVLRVVKCYEYQG